MAKVDQNVKQMVRWISKSNRTDVDAGHDSILDVDNELNEWYAQGFRLLIAFYLGENEAAYGLMYILTK